MCLNRGDVAAAEALFRDSARKNPTDARAVGYLGVALARQRRRPEATAAFRLAARLDPSDPIWCQNLATAALHDGNPSGAEGWAREGLLLAPTMAELHRLLGTALERQRKYDPAAAAYGEAARLNPGLAEVHVQVGRVLDKADRPAAAEPAFREAARLAPADPRAWSGLAGVLYKLDKATDAEGCGREAVRLTPGSPDAHFALGLALAGGDRPEDAEECFRTALRLRSGWPAAHCNLGNALATLGRFGEAEQHFREAVRLRPRSAQDHMNLGTLLAQTGRVEDAIRAYDEALRLRPGFPEARLYRALAFLAVGEFDRAWADYEARWLVAKGGAPKCPAPRWDGGPLSGKVILLHAEQGLGDTIQFVRYATLVKARGAKEVLVDTPRPLAGLLGTCPGVDRAVPSGEPMTGLHLHIPLMSLPRLLGVPPATCPATPPYLIPPTERISYWRRELEADQGLRVGIAWQGSKIHKGDRLRSVRLARFAPLAAIPGVTLYSLQKGPGTDQLTTGPGAGIRIVDLGARTAAGMEDAAAALLALDLLVSVDTALIHLAGAVGVRAWVAVAFAADWRWGRSGEETVWYPTVRLFRQSRPGDWDGVFEKLAVELARASAAKAAGQGAGIAKGESS
ncbi:tetratricopeptide repeat protein [Fimbriiglobus ruber]|uniref:tetratricopeptide repeat protein n=1 Tax=Fimbriiglobus ruber TaxID=1908690 RepID=UPI00137A0BE5|nr:tetratricopeptide repeat protein [Fimbriiglobus ruber]